MQTISQQPSQIASIPRFSSFTAFQNYDPNFRSTDAVERCFEDLHFHNTESATSLVEPSLVEPRTPLSTMPKHEQQSTSNDITRNANVSSLGLDIESLDAEESKSNQSQNQIDGDKFLPFEFDHDLRSSFSSDDDDRVYRIDYETFSPSKYPRTFEKPRTVRFAPCLVSDIHYRPRTTNAEWNQYYYSAHELQSMIDEMRRQQRKRIIVAEEEEDLELW